MLVRLSSAVSVVVWMLGLGPSGLAAEAGRGEGVPLTVEEPSGLARQDWPVTSGIPFARGALADSAPLGLVEAATGRQLPLQTRVTCRWPDGSVKWLLLDTRVSLSEREKKSLALRYGPGAGVAPQARPGGPDLRCETEGGAVRVSTGRLRTVMDARVSGLPGAILADLDGDGRAADEERVSDDSWVLLLETAEGGEYRSDVLPAEVRIEESGPLRTAVRIEGRLADREGRPCCRWLTRLHFYAGKAFIRAFVTLIADVPDRAMADIRSFRLVLPTDGSKRYSAVFGSDAADPHAVASSGGGPRPHRLFQADDREYLIDGQGAGRRSPGWVQWSGGRSSIAAGVRHFWQQWPKAIEAGESSVAIELISSFEPGRYDDRPAKEDSIRTYALHNGRSRLKQGVAKTHELWICYGPGAAVADGAQAFFRQAFEPLLATGEPAYVCATGALGGFPVADPADAVRFMGYDAVVEGAFRDHLQGRERTGEYGLLNFGDWWGERGCNWGNLEYDMQRGLIAQYARTGRREYWLRAEEAARHHIDVDVVHAVNPSLKNPYGPAPAVGDVWVHATGHTGGYYEDGAFGLEKAYTMGYSQNRGHIWTRGDLDYYFLSGDERAREVALRVAETLRTKAAPYFRIGTHMRDIGWPMMAMMAACRATGQREYLEAVRHGWEVLKRNEDPQGGWVVALAKGHCLHEPTQCRGNVGFIMAIVISALCDYHRETGDPEVARSIVRAVDFTLRETYLPERKMFRYTSCPLTTPSAGRIGLMSESLTYAWRLSGDEKYRRVLHEATQTFHDALKRSGMGKGFSIQLIFGPEGLWGLDERAGR